MENPVYTFDILSYFETVFISFWWAILPLPLWYIFRVVWFDYVSFYSGDCWNARFKWTMLEVIPPRDIERGPKPMEIFYTGLAGTMSTRSTFDTWIEGAFRQDFFGFELVSEEGKVHFYIRVLKKHRNLIESQIYAQYPEAQILEVEDYYPKFPKVVPNKNWDMWGSDFSFTKTDYYPIRTYDQFEESITGEMIDPMSALVEVMGSIGPGQHIWLQYVVVPIEEKTSTTGGVELSNKLKGKATEVAKGRFVHDFMDVISNLFPGLFGAPEFKALATKKEELPLDMRLSPIEREVLKAVEENLGKNFFKVKMRLITLGRRDSYDSNCWKAVYGAIKQFNDLNMNELRTHTFSKTYANIFFRERIMAFLQRKIYDRYRRRNMDGANLILSAKELATLFHFPDMSVKSPSLARATSKLGVAPANLPVE